MNGRIATALLAVLLALSGTAAPAAAQLRLDDVDLRLTPRIGLVTPAEWFYDEFAHFGVDPLEWTEAAVLRSSLVGLTAEVEIGDNGLWLRGEVLRTFGGQTYLAHAILHEVSGFNPPVVERTDYYVNTSILMGSLDLAFPTRFTLPFGVQPYVTAGVGAKRYGFDVEGLSDDRNLVLPEEGVEWMLNMGAGVTVEVYGFDLDFVVKDALSEYWEQTQHDVIWLAGVSWAPF